MKLEKIHSGSSYTRQISSSELLKQYVFGNTYPIRFEPGKFYQLGQFVYVINTDGTMSLYQCLESGFYNEINTVKWELASLRGDLNNVLGQITGDTYDLDTTIKFDYQVYMTSDLVVDKYCITLPESITEYTNVVLFLDGKYMSKDLGEYTLNINHHHKCIDVTTPFTDVLLYTITPLNHNAKMIMFNDLYPSSIITSNGKILAHLPFEAVENGYSINVYKNRVYIDPTVYNTYYDEDFGDIILELPLNFIQNKKDLIISVTSSRSKYVSISDYGISAAVTNNIESYRLNVTNGEDYVKDIPLTFKNGLAIPSDCMHVTDNVLSITDEEFYGQIGDRFNMVSYQFGVVLPETTNSTSIMLDAEERVIPVPLLGYTSDIDFLIFYKAGSYISRNRYYIKDGFIHLYEHEAALQVGDVINFEVLDNDEYVSLRSLVKEVNASKSIPLTDDMITEHFLVFNDRGMYIGKSNYTIIDGEIVFNNSSDVRVGDSIEVVYTHYKKNYTNTVTKIGSCKLSANNELLLPIKTYNPTTDVVLIFNSNTGVFISSSRYTIRQNGIIDIHDGSGIIENEIMDVLVVRKLPKMIYTSSINYIMDTL